MVRPGEKISKIQKLFVNAFSNLKKIQFRYVVNLLHKTSIDKGGGSKMIKIQKNLLSHVQLDHSHHSRGWKIRISKKYVFLNHPYIQIIPEVYLAVGKVGIILMIMQDEAHAYVGFCALMKRLKKNFMADGIGNYYLLIQNS